MTINRLSNLEEGDYVYSEETSEVYEVMDIDAEFDEEDTPSGTVTLRDGENIFERDAEDVDFELHDQYLAVIADEIVKNAEEILVEFAEREIGNYLQRLGINHDYNGIDHVETLRDVKAAVFLYGKGNE